jgi:hypothetical protein
MEKQFMNDNEEIVPKVGSRIINYPFSNKKRIFAARFNKTSFL